MTPISTNDPDNSDRAVMATIFGHSATLKPVIKRNFMTLIANLKSAF